MLLLVIGDEESLFVRRHSFDIRHSVFYYHVQRAD